MSDIKTPNMSIAILSLFTSMGTLFCCAFPALLVTLGFGATLAGLIGAAPWITALSDYKVAIFIVGGLLLLTASIMQWRAHLLPCPIDPQKAKACTLLRRISIGLIVFSWLVYATGFFFAFLAVHFL